MATRRRRDQNESAFSEWTRKQPGLDSVRHRISVCDQDLIFHQYRSHTDRIGDRALDNIMLVELKTFAATMPFAQRDTLRLLEACLMGSVLRSDGRRVTKKVMLDGRPRLVAYYGMHVLRLSGDRPDTSKFIWWNNRSIDEALLVKVLRFDADPRTLSDRSDRRHHLPSFRQRHPQLDFGQ